MVGSCLRLLICGTGAAAGRQLAPVLCPVPDSSFALSTWVTYLFGFLPVLAPGNVTFVHLKVEEEDL